MSYTIRIVQVYAPLISHTEEEIEEFYNDVTRAINNNSQSKFSTGYLMGRCGKRYAVLKSRGRYSQYQNIFLANKFFTETFNRKWTSEGPKVMTRNKIDFIIIKKIGMIKEISKSDYRKLRARVVLDQKFQRQKHIRHNTNEGGQQQGEQSV